VGQKAAFALQPQVFCSWTRSYCGNSSWWLFCRQTFRTWCFL